MTVKEIDELARKKADTDKTVTILETGLYYQLRSIYESYDKGDITADDAKAEKERIITAYEADEAALSEYDRLIQQNGDLLQQLEQHRKIFEQDDKRREMVKQSYSSDLERLGLR
jgi:uncharacterized coiled-coil DUF342 family protein